MSIGSIGRLLCRVVPYLVLIGLGVNAITSSVTDHGIMMAVNCICIGILISTLLIGAWVAKMIRRMEDFSELLDTIMIARDVERDQLLKIININSPPIQPPESLH